MYKEVTDKETLLKYWNAEHQFPQWFIEANDVWTMTEQSFLEFCERCWKVYEVDGQALIYVESTRESANVHCSLLRDADKQLLIPSLLQLRTELFETFDRIFGWVVRQNKGLQRICRIMGMKFNGIKMLHGEFHGKVIEWHCYSMLKTDFFVIENQ